MSGLEPYRRRLDELDDQIARALGERFDVCREIALYKRENAIPMMQPQRVAAVRERYLSRGAEVGLPPDFCGALFELLIAATCKMEDELIGVVPTPATAALRARPPAQAVAPAPATTSAPAASSDPAPEAA